MMNPMRAVVVYLTLLLLLEECQLPLVARAVTTKMATAEQALLLGAKLAQDAGYRSRLFAELQLPVKTVRRPVRGVKKSAV